MELITLCISLLAVLTPFTRGQKCSTLTTFNAGLTPHVPEYDIRKPLIPDALAKEGSDVICLQEYWLEADMEEMLTQLKPIYPYHYSKIHHSIGTLRRPLKWYQPDWSEAACSFTDAAYLASIILPCAIYHGCTGVFSNSGSEAGTACLAKKCSGYLQSSRLSADCISCIVLMTNSLTSTLTKCTTQTFTGAHERLNSPGLVVLSQKKILSARYEKYFPDYDMTLERGYIVASIEDVGTVVCTHLTSVGFYYLEYDLDFDNYTVQQKAEIQRYVDKFGSSDHLLAGDLNTGPEVINNLDPEKNVSEEAEDNYKYLMSLGLKSPYMAQDGRCTYCESNPIVQGYNVAIDHILLNNNPYTSITAQRTLDQTNPALSDHYGVRARLCK